LVLRSSSSCAATTEKKEKTKKKKRVLFDILFDFLPRRFYALFSYMVARMTLPLKYQTVSLFPLVFCWFSWRKAKSEKKEEDHIAQEQTAKTGEK